MKINIIDLEPSQLTQSDVSIITFINNSPDKAVQLTINGLANACNTSPASITRFLKKTNFCSYRDMQLYITKRHQEITSNYLLRSENSLHNIAYNIKSYGTYAINESFESLDLKQVEDFIQLIKKSSKIIFFAVGSSQLAATEFACLLQRLNYNAWAFNDMHRTIENVLSGGANNTLVLLSESGSTKEIISIAETLKENNIKLVLITKNQDSKIDRLLTIKILYKTLAQNDRIGSISSMYSQLFIAHLCYASLCSLTPDAITWRRIVQTNIARLNEEKNKEK